MDDDRVWDHTHRERRALARALAGLSEEQWRTDSWCAGWTVREVAAHVISSPMVRPREMAAAALRARGRFNRMVDQEARRLARRPTHEILADFDRYDGSRSHPVGTSVLDPLADILVHTQDALRPLGLHPAMPPEAAAAVARRIRRFAPLFGTGRLARGTRMVATDVAWEAGDGPVLEGPMQELLLALAGRPVTRELIRGDGVALLPTR